MIAKTYGRTSSGGSSYTVLVAVFLALTAMFATFVALTPTQKPHLDKKNALSAFKPENGEQDKIFSDHTLAIQLDPLFVTGAALLNEDSSKFFQALQHAEGDLAPGEKLLLQIVPMDSDPSLTGNRFAAVGAALSAYNVDMRHIRLQAHELGAAPRVLLLGASS